MLKIINVAGAWPNFMKIAPIIDAMKEHPDRISQILVHTGQHYDRAMSQSFFEDLGMPEPDINLGVGSGSHAEQTGQVMIAFEKVVLKEKPDLVLVVGDVNSTMACTIAAKKLGIAVAHVEAGLRSRDMTMPEEINRMCTDILADFLFTTDPIADANLKAEGIADGRIFFVGNVMIDTLLRHRDMANRLPLMNKLGLSPGSYAALTLHRPSNVYDPQVFKRIFDVLLEIASRIPIVFPIHPRTRKMLAKISPDHCLTKDSQVKGLRVTEPLGYLEFLQLVMNAKMVLTDSGGIQEESTVLGVPCITLRECTERPITCKVGTNVIVGSSPEKILAASMEVLQGKKGEHQVPEKWDGKAAGRIVLILLDKLG